MGEEGIKRFDFNGKGSMMAETEIGVRYFEGGGGATSKGIWTAPRS